MDYQKKRELILNGPMNKVILTLSLPLMLNNFIHTVYNLTDTYFISKIGGNEVAGVQFVWPVIFLLMSFGMGMAIATSSLISQYIGAKQQDKAKRVAGQALSFLGVLALVLGALGVLLSPSIVRWMGASGSLYDNGVSYLSIMFAGLPTMFLMNAYNAIKQGQGDTMSPLIIGALSVGTNMILDPIFIFTFGWGIKGAAYATVLSTGLFALYGLFTIFKGSHGIKLSLSDLKWRRDILSQIVHIGLPSSAGQATTAFGFTVLNVFLVSFGEITLTAFAIGNRISSLIMMPAMGIGSALATVVGQNLGADNIARAKKAVRSSTMLSTWMLVVGGGLMYPFSQRIVSAFSQNPEVISQGTEYLKILFLTIPLMGYFQVLVGTFQGSGHTKSAMVLMMGRLWGLRIPMVVFLSRFASFGPSAIWYAMILSNFIICVIGFGILMTGRWQKKVIKSPKFAIDADSEDLALEAL